MDYQRAYNCRGGRVYTQAPRANVGMQQSCQNGQSRNADSCEYPSLAMVYLPYQNWQELYTPCEALTNGTLFKELNKPFTAGRRGGRGSC